MSGELLPPNHDKEALRDTENWKIIFCYFPVCLYATSLLGLFFIIKDDSIKYTILNRSEDEACKVISKFYVTKSKEDALNILF